VNNDDRPDKGKTKAPPEPEIPIVDDENAIDRITNRAWNYIPYEQRRHLTWGEVRLRVSSLEEQELALLYSTFGAADSVARFRQLAETTGLARLIGIPPLAEGGPSFSANDEILDAPSIDSLLHANTPEAQASSTSQTPAPENSVFTADALNAIKPPQTVKALHEAISKDPSSLEERIKDFARRYAQAIKMNEHASEQEDAIDDIMFDLYGERDGLRPYNAQALDQAIENSKAALNEKADETLSLTDRWNRVDEQLDAEIKDAKNTVAALLEKQAKLKTDLQALGEADPEEESHRYVIDDVLADIEERGAQLGKLLEQTNLSDEARRELEREQRFQSRQQELYEQLSQLEQPFLPWNASLLESWTKKQAEFESLCDALLTHIAKELRLLNLENNQSRDSSNEMPEDRQLLRAQLIAREKQLNLRRNSQDFPRYDFVDQDGDLEDMQQRAAALSRSIRKKTPQAEQALQEFDRQIRQLSREIQRFTGQREALRSLDPASDQQKRIDLLNEKLHLADLRLDIINLQRRKAIEGEAAPLDPNQAGTHADETKTEEDAVTPERPPIITIGKELNTKERLLREALLQKSSVRREQIRQELNRINNGAHRGELPNSETILEARQNKKQDIQLQTSQRDTLGNYRTAAKNIFFNLGELPENTAETTRQFIREESMRRIIDCNDLLKEASDNLLEERQRKDLQGKLNGILQNERYISILIDLLKQGNASHFLRQVSDHQQLQDVIFLGRGSDQRLYFAGREGEYSVLYEVPEANQGQLNQRAQQQLGRTNLIRGDSLTFAAAPRWNPDHPDNHMAAYVNWALRSNVVNLIRMGTNGERMENMVFIGERRRPTFSVGDEPISNRPLRFARLEHGFPIAYEFPHQTQGQIAQQAQLQLGRPLQPGDRLTFTTAQHWDLHEPNWNQATRINSLINQERIQATVAYEAQQLDNALYLGETPGGSLRFATFLEGYPLVYDVPPALQGEINQQRQQQLHGVGPFPGDRLTFRSVPHWNFQQSNADQAAGITALINADSINVAAINNGHPMTGALYVGEGPNSSLLFATFVDGYPAVHELAPHLQGQIRQRAQQQLGRTTLQPGDSLTFHAVPAWNHNETDSTQARNINALLDDESPIHRNIMQENERIEDALFVGENIYTDSFLFATFVEGYPVVHELPSALQGQIAQETYPRYGRRNLIEGERLTLTAAPIWNLQQTDVDQANNIAAALQNGNPIRVNNVTEGQSLDDMLFVEARPNGNLLFAEFEEEYPVLHELPDQLRGQVAQSAQRQLGRTNLQAGDRLTIAAAQHWNGQINFDNVVAALGNGLLPLAEITGEQRMENALYMDGNRGENMTFVVLEQGYPILYDVPNEWQGQITQAVRQQFGDADLESGDVLTFRTAPHWGANLSDAAQANAIASTVQRDAIHINDLQENQQLQNALVVEAPANGAVLFATIVEGYPAVYRLPPALQGQIAQQAHQQLGRANLQAGDRLTFGAAPHWNANLGDAAQANAIANTIQQNAIHITDLQENQGLDNALVVEAPANGAVLFATIAQGYPAVYRLPPALQGQIAQQAHQQLGQANLQAGDRLTFWAAPQWNANLGDAAQANAIATTVQHNAIHINDLQENQRLENALVVEAPANGAVLFATIVEGYPAVYRLPPALQGQIAQQAHRQLGRANLQASDRLTFGAVPVWNNNLSDRTQITAINRAVGRNIMPLNEAQAGQQMVQALVTGYTARSRLIIAIIEHGYPATYVVPPALTAQMTQQAQRQLGRSNIQPGDRFDFIVAPRWNQAQNDTTEANGIAAALNQGLIHRAVINNEQQMQQALYIGPGAGGSHLFATHEEGYPIVHEVPHNMQGDMAFRVAEQLGPNNLQVGDRLNFRAAQRWNALQYTPAQANTIDTLLAQDRVPSTVANHTPQLQNALFIRQNADGHLLFATLQDGYPVIHVVTREWQGQIATQARRQLRRADLQPGDQLSFTTRQWTPNRNNRTEANNVLQAINNGTIPDSNLHLTTMGTTLQNAMFITQGDARTRIFATLRPGEEHPHIWYVPHNQQGDIEQQAQRQFRRSNLQEGDVLLTFTTQIHRTIRSTISNTLAKGIKTK